MKNINISPTPKKSSGKKLNISEQPLNNASNPSSLTQEQQIKGLCGDYKKIYYMLHGDDLENHMESEKEGAMDSAILFGKYGIYFLKKENRKMDIQENVKITLDYNEVTDKNYIDKEEFIQDNGDIGQVYLITKEEK